ncbi:hypothetical protein NHX12_014016 [Muraenolepis orangiensis]|uniref:Macro domain-containing protein n=1 Tax=Muraenolepis orangiensis TaxID=630683 RepID=A0A9Q0I4U2_9TELE|nr:hypothetical protein NHX12_014016 [Muraenolepis orangiensis]
MEETSSPSPYGHQVYLECVGLDTEEMKKKVEMYFKVRRKSGGGECGPVEAVEGNVYRIAFKLREDQQRVLERREHTMKDVSVLVHENLPSLLHKTPPITEATPEADNSKVGLSPAPECLPLSTIAASTSPSIGKEHEVHLEGYLLSHLKEYARMVVEKELLTIGGLAQFQLDTGSVMVSSSGQSHPDGDGFKQSEDKVKQVFEKVKKVWEPRESTEKVDIFHNVQGKAEETELSTSKLCGSETELPATKLCGSETELPAAKLCGSETELPAAKLCGSETELPAAKLCGSETELPAAKLCGSETELPAAKLCGSETELPAAKLCGSETELPAAKLYGSETELPAAKLCGSETELPAAKLYESATELPAAKLCGSETELPAAKLCGSETELPDAKLCGSEIELPAAKLYGSKTASSDKLKNRTMDIPGSTVQSNQSYNLPSSREETQSGLLFGDMGSPAREDQGGQTSQHYILPGGVCVLVRHGDITKEQCDALVNAANGFLSHAGGVAAALSCAGGPNVQLESTALVREHGRYATGEAVMTTGGNLQCKKLIHIVRPEQGEAIGRERPLLIRSVGSALQLADDNKFQSIAIPCISSGIFKVPISVCAEAIVTAVETFGRQSQHLKKITLIDSREEVVRALRAACNKILPSADAGFGAAEDRRSHENTGASSPGPWQHSGTNPVNTGEEVGAKVSTTKDHDPRSPRFARSNPRSTTQSHQPPPENDSASHRGYKETQSGGFSGQPLTQHVDQHHFAREDMGSPASEDQGGQTSQCYIFPGGVRVLVSHGDITKEQCDALVNSANGNLDHKGGVAAALSHAGGPAVQRESTALVREHGRYAAGKAVMTTGGNLLCKKLIHIIGPEEGEGNGSEKQILRQFVWSALKLADDSKFQSIAIPCISSAIFKVPISVCAEAIVKAVEHFGRQSQNLNTITLIDTREEVVRALRAACNNILPLVDAGLGAAEDRRSHENTGASSPGPWQHSGTDPVNTGEDQHHFAREDIGSAASEVHRGQTSQRYILPGGQRVLVRHGDITKEQCDALVNSANCYLSHGGGVAAALSRAGGPAVQRESSALVREHGRYATGQVVMTTGGNLQCKKLIHIIGPEQGEGNGSEKQILRQSVWSALKLADDSKFQSIAIPCISSGTFKVPISVCAEAIVTAVEHFGRQSQHLNQITLIDTREEVVRALRAACNKILPSAHAGLEADEDRRSHENTGASSPGPVNTGKDLGGIKLEYIEGYIERQEVDAIVSPMKDHDPRSTGLGKKLSDLMGPELDAAFRRRKENKSWMPVEVNVQSLPELRCRHVFFVNLLPWDEQRSAAAVQTLKCGLRQILSSCQDQGFRSVAFPMLGTGEVLQFPPDLVQTAFLEEIGTHPNNSRPLVVRIVMYPSDKQTNQACMIRTTRSRQASTPSQTAAAHRSAAPGALFHGFTSSFDPATAKVGGVTLQIVHGDIVKEETDWIVNIIHERKENGVCERRK